MKNPLVKPFLKWAGGKRQLLPQIEENMPSNFNHYYEPFVGGGAVFLSLQNKDVTINDFNGELVNTYKVVRDSPEELVVYLKKHDENNSSDYYYDIRSLDRDESFQQLSNVERAARFIYLNKTGYNGLFRVNKKGQINVPYGRYKNPSIVNEDVLNAVSDYLRENKIDILNGDYADALKNVEKNDFVYLDPPYADASSNKSSFVGYTLNGFGDEEQERLFKTFKELDERGAYVMMSNSSVPLIHELYKDYASTTKTVPAKRAINSKASGRGVVDEVLIKNY